MSELQKQKKPKPDISFVLPCLNEERAIGICIDKIHKVVNKNNLNAEIIVVDNGSTDKSAAIARKKGATVIKEKKRGYGSAYKRGLNAARGKHIIMADADDTYDFAKTPTFLKYLYEGYDMVIGNRFGHKMERGVMTWSHQYIGNPLTTKLVNGIFHTGVKDIHSGMRGLTKKAWKRLDLQMDGMEFASEMIIRASLEKLHIKEIPIRYRVRVGDSKLRTIKDGWRHLSYISRITARVYLEKVPFYAPVPKAD